MRVAWYSPLPIEGSGGLRTIFQLIGLVEAAGHPVTVVLDAGLAIPDNEVRGQISGYFGTAYQGELVFGFDAAVPCDLAIATSWRSAYAVARNAAARRKAYLVQDLESLFHPMGADYLFAENSYAFGLTPITIGRWLAHILEQRYGSRSHAVDFCADTRVYRPLEGIARDPRAIAFVHQPEKPRRCAPLGLAALALVKQARPDTVVHLYGSAASQAVGFPHVDHGLLSVADCNALYNGCAVGLCLSSSNPSRIPFEMLAAGLPVVDLRRDNNLHDYAENAVALAAQRPEAIAAALLALLDDPDRLAAMSQSGLAFMAGRAMPRGDAQFLAAMDAILAGDESPAAPADWGPGSPVLPNLEVPLFACNDLLPFIRPAARLLADGHTRAVVCGAGPAGRAAAHLLRRLGVVVAMFSDRKFHYFGGRLGDIPVVDLDTALASGERAFLIGSLAYWRQIQDEIVDLCADSARPMPHVYTPECQ